MTTKNTAEVMTAQDHRTPTIIMTHQTPELLDVMELLCSSLKECFEYVQDAEFDRPSVKTARILANADEALFQAAWAMTKK